MPNAIAPYHRNVIIFLEAQVQATDCSVHVKPVIYKQFFKKMSFRGGNKLTYFRVSRHTSIYSCKLKSMCSDSWSESECTNKSGILKVALRSKADEICFSSEALIASFEKLSSEGHWCCDTIWCMPGCLDYVWQTVIKLMEKKAVIKLMEKMEIAMGCKRTPQWAVLNGNYSSAFATFNFDWDNSSRFWEEWFQN